MPILLVCARCGRNFERKPSQATRANTYCSRQCHYLPVPPLEELRELYEGRTTADLARHYGVDRSVVAGWLDKHGIPRRSLAEAKAIQVGRLTYEDRLRLTEASRRVISVGAKPHEWLVRRAKGVERAAKLTAGEALVLDWLRSRGLRAIPQMAIDKFNVDVAVPDLMLAIEVDGGLWHTRHSPRKQAQDEAKRRAIEPMGWAIVRIRGRDGGTLRRDLEKLDSYLRDNNDARSNH